MNYAVIGIQDDIETSLCVMEHYLPLYFKQALTIYRSMGVEQLIQIGNNSLESEQKILEANSKSVSLLFSEQSLKFTKNETPHKQQISEQARDILRKNMTLEYEFYEFIKQRLKAQVEYLKRKAFPTNWCLHKTNNKSSSNDLIDL